MSAPPSAKKKELTERERSRLAALSPQERFGRNGYTMMPHGYFTVLARKCSGWAQHFAIGYILDRTFGAQGTPQWAKISLATMARLTGLTAKAFSLALEDLAERGLVEREKVGDSWQYRTWPEAWINCADYEPKAAAAAASAPEDDSDSENEATAAAPAERPTHVEVQPGKSAKPIVLSVAIKGHEQPVDLRFQPRNESGLPLLFATSVDSGVVRFTVSQSVQKAKTREVQFIPPAPVDASRKTGSYEVQFIGKAATSPPSQRLTDFTAYLSVVCLKHFPTAADPVLIRNVIAAAGAASVDEYAQIVEARLRRRGRHTPGLLIELAKDAARANAARIALAESEKRAPAEPSEDREAWERRMRAEYGSDPEALAMLGLDSGSARHAQGD